MNPVHTHLLTNHLPIFGTLFGLLLFGVGLMARNNSFRSAAYFLFFVAALSTPVVYFSGEEAEETVERIQGISETSLEAHEDAAVFSSVASVLIGVLAIAGLVVGKVRPAWNGRMSLVIGAGALVAFAIAARTGYLGGKIRHTELSAPPAISEETE